MKLSSACLPVASTLLTLSLTPVCAAANSIESDEPARPFEIQGHRGASGLAPENSIAAFERAIALGTDTLEMDAQSTRDRVLVIYHDQKIDGARCRRTDGGALSSKLLKDLTLEEVRTIRCAQGAAIPTLEEVLRLAHDAPYLVRANVEIKMQDSSRGIPVGEFTALLVNAIDASGMRGRVLVQSFDAEALLAMRRIAPDIPRAVIGRNRDSYLTLVEDTTASALLPRRDRLQPEDVEALHARGVVVIPWVVDDPDEMRRLRSWGVDGIITNRPDLALRFRDGPRPVSPDVETTLPPPTPWPPPVSAPAPEPAPSAPSPLSKPPVPAAAAAPRAYNISEIRKVAVTYFTSGGKADTFLTSLFLEEFRKRQPTHELIDPYQMSFQPMDGERFHQTGMLPELLKEAEQLSAQAIIIGVGKWYGPGTPGLGFRLEARLIEIREGKVLWQAAIASGPSFSGPKAKGEVVKKVLRSYPGMRRH